jgi:hypothetical protein
MVFFREDYFSSGLMSFVGGKTDWLDNQEEVKQKLRDRYFRIMLRAYTTIRRVGNHNLAWWVKPKRQIEFKYLLFVGQRMRSMLFFKTTLLRQLRCRIS